MPSEISLQIHYGSQYKNYTLTYKENSSAIYESYSEYYYSKATNEFKIVTQEDVKKTVSAASYELAYRYDGYLTVSSNAAEYPTGQYKVEQHKYTIEEKSEELFAVLGNDISIIYALKPEVQS